MPELDATEVKSIGHEPGTCSELKFTTQLAFNLLLFHLRGRLKLFLLGLGRETFLIGTVDSITDIEEILRHKKRVIGYKREEGHFILCRQGEFGHNLNMVALFPGQLILHLESADRVDIVAKEVYSIGVFATEGIDVEDGSTQGELTWLVDIVYFMKAELMEGLLNVGDSDSLVFLQHQRTSIKVFLGDD